jgi:hypothetical protein
LQKEFIALAKLSSKYKPIAQQVAFRKPVAEEKSEVAGANAIREARAAKKVAKK